MRNGEFYEIGALKWIVQGLIYIFASKHPSFFFFFSQRDSFFILKASFGRYEVSASFASLSFEERQRTVRNYEAKLNPRSLFLDLHHDWSTSFANLREIFLKFHALGSFTAQKSVGCRGSTYRSCRVSSYYSLILFEFWFIEVDILHVKFFRCSSLESFTLYALLFLCSNKIEISNIIPI